MTDRALLVPMSVDALVVPTGGQKAVNLSPRLDLFDDVKLGAMLRPQPWELDDLAIDLDEGVHLHWRLPAALTHGVQTAAQSGQIEFPRVPNRWLVLRIAAIEAQSRAWIVRSDDVADTGTTTVLLTTKPSAPAPETASATYAVRKIGKAYGFEEPWEDAPAGEVELTAVSPGNPIFAAFYPGCRNVFGFRDDLDGVAEGTFLYFVAGWYGDPEHDDPLSPSYGQPLLASHVKEQWGFERFLPKPPDTALASAAPAPAATPPAATPPMPAAAPPTRTVCHGTVYGVRWKRSGPRAEVGAPVYRVAVGNTAVEALSAVVAAPAERGRLWEPLLSAFLYGALAERNPMRGMPEIDAELHRRRFQPIDGGTQWIIQRVESDTTTAAAGVNPIGVRDERRPSFPEDPDVATLYGALHDKQREHDRLARELAALREEAYAAWFRRQRGGEPNAQAVDALLRSLAEQIVAMASTAAGISDEVRDLCGALQRKGIRIPTGAADGEAPARPEFELVTAPMPWFWRASDPAIVVATPGVSRAHRWEADRAACRVIDEVVKALDVSATALGTSMQGRRVVDVAMPKLPIGATARGAMPHADVVALVHESLLLDPGRAADIAVRAYAQFGITESPASARVTALARTLRDALGRDAKPADQIRPIGVRPDGALTWWEPAWDPLFMVWEVAWAPTYTGSATADAIRRWTQGDDGEYRWTGDPGGEARRYLGWAPLSIDLSRHVQERLKTAPEIARAFTSWGVLTQMLGGLHDALIMREHTLQLPPLQADGTVDDVAARLLGASPTWSPIDADPRGRQGFFPIRAGHLAVQRLWLADSFGRLAKVFDSDRQPADVTAAESLRGTRPGPWVAVPPRITQPARLLFQWRSATGRESTADPRTSPIAGWIIPDHLDTGLLVCDAQGRARGELRLATGQVTTAGGHTTEGVSWSATPGFAERWDPDTARALADAPDLRRFVDGLTSAGGPALRAVLELIDHVSMRITTGGARHGGDLYAGQPLALARASLRVEVWGRPATDQRTAGTSTGGIGSVRVPVRLGDVRKGADGLVGYFPGDDRRLRAVFGAPAASPSSPYFAAGDLELSLDGGPVNVTLLMDPRASVHLAAGIFPAQALELPGHVFDGVLAGLQQTFRVGPVLGDHDALRIPVPDSGWWAWVDRDRDREHEWAENAEVAKPEVGPAIPARPLRVHEGWLTVRPVDPGPR